MTRELNDGFMLIPDSHDPAFRPVTIDYNDEAAPPVRILGKIVWWCGEF